MRPAMSAVEHPFVKKVSQRNTRTNTVECDAMNIEAIPDAVLTNDIRIAGIHMGRYPPQTMYVR
jgi:hypothetical protein